MRKERFSFFSSLFNPRFPILKKCHTCRLLVLLKIFFLISYRYVSYIEVSIVTLNFLDSTRLNNHCFIFLLQNYNLQTNPKFLLTLISFEFPDCCVCKSTVFISSITISSELCTKKGVTDWRYISQGICIRLPASPLRTTKVDTTDSSANSNRFFLITTS